MEKNIMENFWHQIKTIALKSGKTKLAIIGKGNSVKDLNTQKLKDFFVINLNDSERILPGDIALFYRTDFYDQIKKQGFQAHHYIAPGHFKISAHQHIPVKYQTTGQDHFDQTFDYFQQEDFHLTDFTILSAIKLAILYQKAIEKPIDVYFLGFDFRAETLHAEDYPMHDLQYKNVFLKTQESIFTAILGTFGTTYPAIRLTHVGEKVYSALSGTEFNRLLKELSFSNEYPYALSNNEMYGHLLKECKESGRVIIVAEFTNNHIGDPVRLIEMIELAKENGADMIKLQKRDVDTFYTQQELSKPYNSPFGNTLGDYRRAVELDKRMFELLDEHCRKNQIPWFTSVLDWKSYEFMMDFSPALLKLPSTISDHKNYLLKVGDHYKGDLVISTGFTDHAYENFVFENFMIGRNLFLLQCTSSYPTPPEACQIAVVRHYEEIHHIRYPNLLSGYSSHDVGSLGCMLAVAAGAKMLEKHVKLGNLDWVHFDGVALDLYGDEFKNFVHDVRKTELMCGTPHKNIHTAEHHKYTPNTVHN